MSSKSSKRKNQQEKDRAYIKGYRIPDYLNYLYLFVMFTIYPIITDNKYFNITITRYNCFAYAAAAYIIALVIGYIIESTIEDYNGYPSILPSFNKKKRYAKPEFWMEAFLVANIFACICADDSNNAFSGKQGRFMGLLTYMLIAFMFIIMTQRLKINMIIYMFFAAATAYAYIIAIVQHSGYDILNYKDGISAKQYNIFISTMGNINIFASFITITTAVFLCMFIFAKEIYSRIVAAILIVGGGFCIMIANSDSVYLGLVSVLVLLFFLAYKDGCVKRFVCALIFLAIGNLGVVLLNKYVVDKFENRGGFAQIFDNIKMAVIILIALVVLYGIVAFVAKKFKDKLESLNKKKVILILLGIMLVGAGVIVIAGVASGHELFKFNYKWGTYRGYIWSKCVELFNDAPLTNKLFGYGNETLKELMNSSYRTEMLEVTGKVYDNAHNEVLQYLVTTGLLGAISYIGLFITSCIYMIKNSKNDAIVYISLAVTVGYFVQGLINLNQPITTPFYFLFMAMGIGHIRYQKKVEEYSA